MVDLETWGKVPGAALRSIGAVVFDPRSGDIEAEFYRNIDEYSYMRIHMHRDPETVDWWSKQSAAAHGGFADPAPVPLDTALAQFILWWREHNGEQIYGHGANFDPPLLEAAYTACGMEAPWQFWDVRCCRTILAMAKRKPDRTAGTHHNALDDAIAQAKAVAAAFRHRQFNPN
jgi:hypothetical protein